MSRRCVGLLGWIFGHKFLKSKGGWLYAEGRCYRCGWDGR